MSIRYLSVIPFIHLCHYWFLRWHFLSNSAVHSRLLVTLLHIRQTTGRRSNSDGVDESERQADRRLRGPRVSKSYLPDFLSGCHGLYKLRLRRVTGPARLAEVSVNICICYVLLFIYLFLSLANSSKIGCSPDRTHPN